MKLLFLGDVLGSSDRKVIKAELPGLREALEIAALQQEVKEVRAQCAVLIKENTELNAALEEAKQVEAELEAQQQSFSSRLDNAIDQVQGLLKAGSA